MAGSFSLESRRSKPLAYRLTQPALPANSYQPSAISHEPRHELRQRLGLLHLHEMAAVGDDLKTGLRQRLRVKLAGAEWHDAVVVAPDHERGRSYAAEQVRQGGVEHVRLPGDTEDHVAVDLELLELLG